MVRRTHMTKLSGWREAGGGRGVLEECSLVVPTYNRHTETFRARS
jgi:hypothetical protein